MFFHGHLLLILNTASIALVELFVTPSLFSLFYNFLSQDVLQISKALSCVGMVGTCHRRNWYHSFTLFFR